MQFNRPELVVKGAWIESEEITSNSPTFAVLDPATNAVVANVLDCGAHEARTALDAADKALPAWSALLARERANLLRRWHT